MFQYYKPEEKFALAQVAKRIDTLEGANWHGYHGGDILEPHLNRGIRNGRKLNDYQWYPIYRQVVTGYPTFLELVHQVGGIKAWRIAVLSALHSVFSRPDIG